MAKTKLQSDVTIAFHTLKGNLTRIQQKLSKFEEVSKQDVSLLDQQYKTLEDARNAMVVHLDKLNQRANPTTVANRLRNLKNIFKNQDDLKAQRAAVRDAFNGMRAKIFHLLDDTNAALDEIELRTS
jgi:hypothetical protein